MKFFTSFSHKSAIYIFFYYLHKLLLFRWSNHYIEMFHDSDLILRVRITGSAPFLCLRRLTFLVPGQFHKGVGDCPDISKLIFKAGQVLENPSCTVIFLSLLIGKTWIVGLHHHKWHDSIWLHCCMCTQAPLELHWVGCKTGLHYTLPLKKILRSFVAKVGSYHTK